MELREEPRTQLLEKSWIEFKEEFQKRLLENSGRNFLKNYLKKTLWNPAIAKKYWAAPGIFIYSFTG